jgi:2-keto-4-pentenoate hydratase/2-oxohepta-3-ene-1,7-dioic acid hydratase in catechol pathway
MRLVTYRRHGVRRLGAWVERTVVDLPDAVGHPAFPTTMEALVSNNGGTLLDAARHALAHPDVLRECAVPRARLLIPLIPSSLRSFVPPADDEAARRSAAEAPGSANDKGHRLVLGPDDEVAWPRAVRYLGCELEVACIVGRRGRRLSRAAAAGAIFGYTLMGDWSAWENGRGRTNGQTRTPSEFAVSLGPCVVTPDEFDPSGVHLVARIADEIWSEGSLDTTGPSFPEIIAEVSRTEEVVPGEVYGSAAFGFGYRVDPGKALRRGTVVELEADGIGVLRNRVSASVR